MASTPIPGNYDILLVDDQPIYHDVVRAIVESRGFSTISMASAEAAIESAQTREYTLILMDIDLPGVDGYRAAHRLRALGGWAAICPIIAFTTEGADRAPEDRVTDDHLAKPFSAGELLRMIDKWTGAVAGTVEPDPGARLAGLIGADAVAGLVDRFHIQLDDARRAAAGDDHDIARLAHRIGGLAGTLGYGALSAAWLAVQHDIRGGLALALKLTDEALTRHAARLPKVENASGH